MIEMERWRIDVRKGERWETHEPASESDAMACIAKARRDGADAILARSGFREIRVSPV